MISIVCVGMNVHKESYSLGCYSFDTDSTEYELKVKGDYRRVLK